VGAGARGGRQPGDDEPGAGARGAAAKKKSLIAAERDEAARAAWRAEHQVGPADDLVFVDECGAHVALTPLYAWAPGGARAYGAVPHRRGENTTLIAALSAAGLGAAMTLRGAADGAAFEAYVEHALAPTLLPGQTVVMDNLSAHKRPRVRELIAARGCRVLFLPPYSPDLAPIEPAFSKVKGALRRAGARTHDALAAAFGPALDAVTPQDARGWFRHCGYHLSEQPL